MTQPTVAVTGAAGYIGSRVLHDLQKEHPDCNVRALDNFYLGDIRQVGDVEVEHVDIRDRDRLEDALEGADVVLHLAAISGVDDCEQRSDLAYEVNVQGTTNVAWHCRKTGAALVFPFSMATLGDPLEFPITVDHPRDPLNWYGRTKQLGEQTVETMAEGAFPAHCYLKSNLYGGHHIGEQWVSKGTVINFFINRAIDDKTLTVYEPGTQARNFIHVKDVAQAYVRSTKQLLDSLELGKTGIKYYEIASDEDPSVMEIAQLVQRVTYQELNLDIEVELRENPREETLVTRFDVDNTRTQRELGWECEQSVEQTIKRLLSERGDHDV